VAGTKAWDELWVEVKCQSNPEIASSPRNAFRCSPGNQGDGGRALNGLGGVSLPNPIKPPMPSDRYPGVRLPQISAVVKRETAQTTG
jgi:hypothetical protein